MIREGVKSLKIDRLFRNQSYTTDGFFLIKSKLEPYDLKRKQEVEAKPDCNALVKRTMSDTLVEVYPKDIISQEQTGNRTDIQEFTNNSVSVFINPEFLKYFKKCKKLKYYFSNTFRYAPLVLKNNDEFVGLIMCVRKD